MTKVRYIAAALLIALFTTAAFLRASLYRDDAELWADSARKSPNKARPHNNLGHALKEQGRLEEATIHFERAVALDPDYPDALNNLSTMYNNFGRKDEALALLQRVIELSPGHLQARFNLAIRYYEMGMTGDASREYMTIIQLSPFSKEAAFARKMLAMMRQ